MICREFGISQATLKRNLGKGFNLAENIRRVRVHRAARDILSDGEVAPINAIARRWGMRDERTFRRVFHQEFGCAPSQFRASRSADEQYRASLEAMADMELWLRFS